MGPLLPENHMRAASLHVPLSPAPLCALLCGHQCLPYDATRLGVPVTRHTAATGVLVRRGYDGYRTGRSAPRAGKVRLVEKGYALRWTCHLILWSNHCNVQQHLRQRCPVQCASFGGSPCLSHTVDFLLP